MKYNTKTASQKLKPAESPPSRPACLTKGLIYFPALALAFVLSLAFSAFFFGWPK